MIKKYKHFLNEGVLDKLKGPSIEEVIDNIDSFGFKIKNETHFNRLITLFKDLDILGNELVVGSSFGDREYFNYTPNMKEFSFSLEEQRHVDVYHDCFGYKNFLVSISTEEDIKFGDAPTFKCDNEEDLIRFINGLKKKAK